MLGLMLGSFIVSAAAERIGETIAENAIPLAAAATVATVGAVAGSVSRPKQSTVDDGEVIRARQDFERREEQRRIQADMDRELRERKTMIRTNALNELYAKFAISCYIAWADGVLSADEKKNLDAVFLDIYNQFSKADDVKKVLLKIYNTPHMNFLQLEKYLRNTSPEVIASFLTVADEIAESDGNVSEEEKKCIYKIRKYLTDRTGQNYMGQYYTPDSSFDPKCPGCAANMEIEPHNNRAVCHFCGNIRYLGNHKPYESVRSPVAQLITFRCPICNTLLSTKTRTCKCTCSSCRSILSVIDGVPSVWN